MAKASWPKEHGVCGVCTISQAVGFPQHKKCTNFLPATLPFLIVPTLSGSRKQTQVMVRKTVPLGKKKKKLWTLAQGRRIRPWRHQALRGLTEPSWQCSVGYEGQCPTKKSSPKRGRKLMLKIHRASCHTCFPKAANQLFQQILLWRANKGLRK